MTDLLDGPATPGGASQAEPGAALPLELREDVFRVIATFSGEYADVLARYREGLTKPGEIAATGAAGGDAAAAGRALLRIRFMLGDPATTAPRRARKVAGTVRAVAGRPGVTPAVREWLGGVVDRLETLAATEGPVPRRAGAPRTPRPRPRPVAEQNEAAEYARSGSCVYVYTFPTYWQQPDGDGRRLLKVGMTTVDAPSRIFGQARLTASPEDPLILRVYPTDNPAAVEATFHQLLRTAGHVGPPTRVGGTEWFPTTLQYLDTVAGALGLRIIAGALPG